jgi:hypothetical protein
MELTIYDQIELPKTERKALWAAVKDMKESGLWITNHKRLIHEMINL